MYKSEFANSLSNIRDETDVGIGGDKIEDNNSWLSHDQFRDPGICWLKKELSMVHGTLKN